MGSKIVVEVKDVNSGCDMYFCSFFFSLIKLFLLLKKKKKFCGTQCLSCVNSIDAFEQLSQN